MPKYGFALFPDEIIYPQAHVCKYQDDADFCYGILKIDNLEHIVRYARTGV